MVDGQIGGSLVGESDCHVFMESLLCELLI